MTVGPESTARVRFVFDTNALASAAILPDSVSGQALAWAIAHGQLCLSTPVLAELVDVLHRPRLSRYFEGDALQDFLMTIARVSEFFEPAERIKACRDPRDDMLLELAVAAEARFLISGDADLRVLSPFRGIRVVTAGELAAQHEGFTTGP